MTQPNGEPSYPPPPGSPYGPAPQPHYGPAYGQPPPTQPPPTQPQPYAPAPYGSHGPYGHAGAYGYAGPYGPPRPARVVSNPPIGWVIFGAGALMVIGALLPWATSPLITVGGLNGDGLLTLPFGMVIAAMGLVIALGNGLLWTSILAAVFGALTTLTAIVDIAHISTISSRFDDIDVHVRVGIGLWLTLVTAVAALVAAIVAMAQRRPAAG